MTFWAQGRDAQEDAPVPPEERPDLSTPEPARFLANVRAGFHSETVRTDAWGYQAEQRRRVAQDMFDALPEPAQARIRERQQDRSLGWMALEGFVLEEAGAAAAAEPVRWGNRPLSLDQLEAEVLRRARADLDEAERVLALPGGGFAGFLGAAARAVSDPTSIALMPLGLGGSAARVIASEAVLGAVGEAAVLPREFRVADQLELEPPNAFARIALGAVAGGGLAAGLTGLGRAAGYLAARHEARATGRPADIHRLDHQARVAAAEARLRDEIPPREATRPPLPARVASSGAASVDDDIVNRIIGIESGGNPAAQNPASSAAGLGQFIDSTWLAMLQKHRPDIVEGRSRYQLLQLKFDPALSREMTAAYVADNRAFLESRGLPITPGSLYLAHFAGPEGAARILAAALNAPISAVMTPAQIAANRGIRRGGKSFSQFTVGDLQAWAASKMGSASPVPPSGDMPVFSRTSRGFTGEGQVRVSDDLRIDVEYEVVDASILRQASGDLQPRDRSRINSDAWVAETAAGLDPALLRPAPTADRGAPIVGPDDVIESGNGRVRAIVRAYERFPDRAAAYRAMIEAETGAPIPEGMAQPVLVARRRTEVDDAQRAQLVRDAQDSGVARMTPTEISEVTGRAMTAETLALLQPGARLGDAENAPFVKRALGRLPASERNALFDATGALNAEGARRLRQALFARAWPDRQLVGRYAELEDAGPLKSLLTALERAAPEWAALRSDIEAGLVRPDFDISPFVIDAMRLIAGAREAAARGDGPIAGILEDMLAEVDLLEGALPDVTVALVRKFYPNGKPASADDIAEFLGDYARRARDVGQPSMLGDDVGAANLLRSIDGETFGGVTSIPARAADEAATITGDLPPRAYDDGASSPEAEIADAAALEELTTPTAQAQVVDLVALDEAIETMAAARAATAKLNARSSNSSRRAADASLTQAYAQLKASLPRLSDAEMRALQQSDPATFAAQVNISRLPGQIDEALKAGVPSADIKERARNALAQAAAMPDAPAASPATRREAEEAVATLGDDFEITLPDGTPWRASEILADVQEDLDLADVIELCKIGGPGA